MICYHFLYCLHEVTLMIDRYTGQDYNPEKEFNQLFQEGWFIDQMIRMQNEVVHDQWLQQTQKREQTNEKCVLSHM